jgi:chromosomal replication initiation ATPase DnaA
MENIQVAVRVRPLSQKEITEGEIMPWRIRQNTIEITKQDSESPMGLKKPSKQSYCFDHCFPESQSNEQIYIKVAKSVVTSCLEGYNGTIFMYGQTGSGKTYTMLGYNHQAGLYSSIAANEQSLVDNDKDIANLGIDDLQEKYPDFIYDHSKEGFENNTGILIQSLRDIFDKIENVE